MSDTPEPILVYRRINSNKRATALLLASFPVALLPVVAASTVILARITRAGFPGALLVSTVLLLAAACFIAWYGSDMVLLMARARRLRSDEELELVRTVENLCIGAGLPVPAIRLIDSRAPNAMATGSDPQHASLAVTRGLLALLNHRELESVIAHELSHIGNHDTRLNTILVALVGIACFPIRVCAGSIRNAWAASEGVYSHRHTAFWIVGAIVLLLAAMGLANAPTAFDEHISPPWSAVGVMAAPLYVLLLSPLAALRIRQGVANERELLADADAVRLTRDPEGLALALVKVSAAQPEPLVVGEGCTHLYFVDPREKELTLLKALFPSHPPVMERIHVLARMGNVQLSALRAAFADGENRRLQFEMAPEP